MPQLALNDAHAFALATDVHQACFNWGSKLCASRLRICHGESASSAEPLHERYVSPRIRDILFSRTIAAALKFKQFRRHPRLRSMPSASDVLFGSMKLRYVTACRTVHYPGTGALPETTVERAW